MDELRSRWQPDHSMQTPWVPFTVGFFVTFQDAAMGMAFASTLAPDESFTHNRG